MSQLNSQQYDAIRYLDGPLLVIAGAGTGKTRVITQKITYLIEFAQIPAKHIYAVTFTNKAAREMGTRINQLLKPLKGQRQNISISTFHALGLQFLKKEGHYLNLTAQFSLFDTIDSLNLLKELGSKVAAISDESLLTIQQTISNWKNSLLSPDQALLCAADEQTHLAARFFNQYEHTLRAYNAVDFDDLITLPVQLFQTEPLVLEKWQNIIRYLLIDEYQDTNAAQYQLIKLLCGVRQAFTAVGDDDQSIYTWRGAKPENIQLLQKDYPRLHIIKLEQNYRSTSAILNSANHLIKHNPHSFEKRLWSTLGQGDPIRIIATSSDEAEAERIVHEIITHRFRYRLPYHYYAILYRSNHQAKMVEQALRLQGIAYQISGGQSFFSRSEIKDLFAYFRLFINPDDDAAFLRCVNTPRRDIGPSTLEKLSEYAKQRQMNLLHASLELGLANHLPSAAVQRVASFAEGILRTKEALNNDCIATIDAFIKEIHYLEFLAEQAPNAPSGQKRIENVKDLLNWLKRLLDPLAPDPLSFNAAIQKMMLSDILERQNAEQNTEAVQLLTLHAAKGLEFPYVFIMGWEEECLPHKNSMEADLIHEERRLAYVGMTRAQQNLVLTYAEQRKRYGEWHPTTPSRFLAELPEELIVREGRSPKTSLADQQTLNQTHFNALRALLKES